MEIVRGLSKKKEAVVVFCFFLFWMVFDGPHIAVDSRAYLTMYVGREPLYPLFLAFCRLLPFSQAMQIEGYAGVRYAVFFQNLLWIYAVYQVGRFVHDLCTRSAAFSERMAKICTWSAIGLQFAVCLINRFLVPRRTMYANEVLTEAFTMPLFLLFTIRLAQLLCGETGSRLLRCAILGFLLIGIRQQMQIVLIVWAFMAVCCRLIISSGRNIRMLAVHVGLIAGIILCNRLTDCCYHAAVHGFFGRIDGRASYLGTMLYVADEGDAGLFGEDAAEEKALFLKITGEQKARGARHDAVPEDAGVMQQLSHFSNQFDVIIYEIAHPIVMEKAGAEAENGTDPVVRLFSLEGSIAGTLLRQDLSHWFRVVFCNFLGGMALSIARMENRLIPVVIILYLLYVVLWIACVRKQRIHDGGREVILYAFMIPALITINSIVIAAIIFPTGRYMIYGMGLFYTTLLLMAGYLRGTGKKRQQA